jgi:hypothetical protein
LARSGSSKASSVPHAERAADGASRSLRVQRADRVRDWIALSLVIAGAVLYGAAQLGMGAVARDRIPTTAEAAARGEWKMVRWNKYERLSRAGIFLVGAGAAGAVLSFARHAVRRRGASHAS